MKLELASFNVDRITLTNETRLSGNELRVDASAVKDLVLSEDLFRDVDVHAIHPGDQVRILHALDVVEPRHKVSGPGQVFPGVLGPPLSVGEGRTHVLRGATVVTAGEPVEGEPVYWREAIIDMFGPGADYSPFSSTANLVLDIKARPVTGADTEHDNTIMGSGHAGRYNRAVRKAGFKVASWLASITADLPPDSVDTFELTPVDPSLPKIFYASQESTQFLYGETMGWQPTLIHPNEYADGVIYRAFNGPASIREASYFYQNHRVLADMYARHGKDINFGGVLLYPFGPERLEEKERITGFAAKLLDLMEADGVVISFVGGGHPGIDPMLLCQKCEQLDIRTTLMYPEMAAGSSDPGFVHFVPEADAVVSVGNYEQIVTLPPAPKVIGGTTVHISDLDAYGELPVTIRHLYGASSPMGDWKLAGVQY